MAQVNHPSNLIDRVIALERELAEVRKKVGLSSATISSGGLTVDGGFIKLRDPEDHEIFYIGPDLPNRPDGSRQQVVILNDDNGTNRFFIWDDDPSGVGGYRQYVAIVDSEGHRIFQDDKVAGNGLARPWIPMRTMRTRFLDWPKCAIGVWETMHEIRMPSQQPSITISIVSASDAGTTGQIRVMEAGVQRFIRTVTAGTIFVDNVHVDNNSGWQNESTLNVDAIRTAGAGNVGVEIRYAYGWGLVS